MEKEKTKYAEPIATELEKATVYWPAEVSPDGRTIFMRHYHRNVVGSLLRREGFRALCPPHPSPPSHMRRTQEPSRPDPPQQAKNLHYHFVIRNISLRSLAPLRTSRGSYTTSNTCQRVGGSGCRKARKRARRTSSVATVKRWIPAMVSRQANESLRSRVNRARVVKIRLYDTMPEFARFHVTGVRGGWGLSRESRAHRSVLHRYAGCDRRKTYRRTMGYRAIRSVGRAESLRVMPSNMLCDYLIG